MSYTRVVGWCLYHPGVSRVSQPPRTIYDVNAREEALTGSKLSLGGGVGQTLGRRCEGCGSRTCATEYVSAGSSSSMTSTAFLFFLVNGEFSERANEYFLKENKLNV